MAQQTAVEWLVNKLNTEFIRELPIYRWSEVFNLVEKAKQMEKEQITDSYIMGSYDMAAKEFIPYEQALELKELGFDEECLATYNFNQELETGLFQGHYDVPAPLYQQAFRWFRKNHDLEHIIGRSRYNSWYCIINGCNVGEKYETYEEAELACLKKLIEIIKNK